MELQTFNGMVFKPYPECDGTLVCLAGSEAREFMDVFIEMNVRSVLLSFFYLRRKFKRNKELIERLKDEFSNFDYIFCDSGGFTLQQEKRRGKLKVQLQDYIKQYRDFALEMQEHITVFGAIDSIEEGYDFNDYIDHVYDFKDNGIHIAPTVWIDTPWDIVEKTGFLEEFDIVGLSGAKRDRKKAIKQYSALKKSGVKVHGYAATSQEHFQYFKFFSVDSISWLTAQRFGLTFDFRGGKMRTISPYMKMETRRHLLGRYGEYYDIDTKSVLLENQLKKAKQSVSQDIYDEVNKLNLVAWIKLAEQERFNKHRAYWHNSKLEYDFIGE
jgi:hypothetical protein